ncbi:MAG: glycosyltransferase family 2 protein [Gammaproteobacteria bacterium]|nr:glycosyltransferase family 2 protein [Gammaproteobacteria bacterium]
MLADIVDIIQQLDFDSFFYMFWYFIIFDVPRYLLSLLAIMISLVVERKNKYPPLNLPVSFLLVGHNEADGLQRSVMSLAEQTHKGEVQIVVVDDGSADDTAAVAKRLRQQGLIDVFVSSGIRGGKAAALNLGLGFCQHEIVICADMDTSFDRDAVERLVSRFADPQTGAVAGNLYPRNGEYNLVTRLQAMEYLMSISMGRRFTSMMGILTIVSGAFGAFRKEALLAVGGWDVGPGDDGNVTNKLRRAGWRINFAHDAWAATKVPVTTAAYIKQRMRWNRSVIRYKLRKFRSAYNPGWDGFRGRDVIALSNVLFFQVVLTLSFFTYLFWLFYQMGESAFYVVGTITLVYLIEDMLTFALMCLIYRAREPERLGIYLLASTVFESYVARGVRFFAYLDELIFRRSFKDTFVPVKVKQVLERF